MLQKIIISIAIVCVSCCAESSYAQGITAWEANARLGRAINLGNALEAPYEGQWGVILREEYFQIIKDGGFNGVRIPIRWNAHADDAYPYTIDPEFMARVEWVVDNALSRGLVAIIDFHHYEELTDIAGRFEQARFLGIWSQVAEHFSEYPDELLFELLNEPHGQLIDSIWNGLLVQAIDVIRQSNPYRNIIVGGTGYNSKSKLISTLKLPENDRHIIVTYHHYDPFEFTHQGASWVGGNSDSWLGTTWEATPQEVEDITSDFDAVYNWSVTHDRPVFMGEFGAYSKADMDSRMLWTDFCAREAEKRGFSWAYWEFCAGFGAYDDDTGKWRELLRALIPDAPVQNQIRNGQFDFGLEHWKLEIQDRAAGSVSIINETGNALVANITDGGFNEASFIVRQQDISLEDGKSYRIGLRAKAENERTIILRLQNGATVYWQQLLLLSTDIKRFTYIFDCPTTNSDIDIRLLLGGNLANVYIDDVEFKEAWDCQQIIGVGLRLPADVSGPDGASDCHIDIYDLMALAERWLINEGEVDISGPVGQTDGIVNFHDFAEMAGSWLQCNNLQDTSCDYWGK